MHVRCLLNRAAGTNETGMAIGNHLKQTRKARGETQGDLADAMGVTQAAVSRWENNSVEMTVSQLRAVCEHWGMTLADFFGATPEPDDIQAMEYSPLSDAVTVIEADRDARALPADHKTRVISMLYTLAADLRAAGRDEQGTRSALKRDLKTIVRVAGSVRD